MFLLLDFLTLPEEQHFPEIVYL